MLILLCSDLAIARFVDGEAVEGVSASRSSGEDGGFGSRVVEKDGVGLFDTAIWTPALPPYRYPDASAACGELEFKHVRGVDALVNPVLLVEVLSPSTASRDGDEKFAAYGQIESFQDYLLIAQHETRVTHYARRGDEGVWERRDVIDIEASLTLESVGCALKMRDIYEGVAFAA